MVHAATPKVMTAEETSAMTRRCMESAKTVRITLTHSFVAKTKSGLMLVDDTRSAVKTRAMIAEGECDFSREAGKGGEGREVIIRYNSD